MNIDLAICYSQLTSIARMNWHDGRMHLHFALHLSIRRSGWVYTFQNSAFMIRLSSFILFLIYKISSSFELGRALILLRRG